jgi:hypothetical protein
MEAHIRHQREGEKREKKEERNEMVRARNRSEKPSVSKLCLCYGPRPGL